MPIAPCETKQAVRLQAGGTMSRAWIEAYKPAANRSGQHLTLALMWSVVGAGLLGAGSSWLMSAEVGAAAGLLLLGLAAGAAKARWVMRGVVDRIVRRIDERGDGRCLGGFLSWRSWGFVLLMMTLGRVLRGTHLPRLALGSVYVAVGAALLLASSRPWRRWQSTRSKHHQNAHST